MTDPRDIATQLHNAVLLSQCDAGEVTREVLDMLAVSTGQNSFRFAAAIIGGARLGRTAIDDQEALKRIAAFAPARRREAVGAVADSVAAVTGEKTKSVANRLRRKIRQNETGKMLLPAPARP